MTSSIRVICMIGLIVFPSIIFTQPIFPYQFKPKNQKIILPTIVVVNALGFVLDQRSNGLTTSQLGALKSDDIRLGIDRSATRQWSPIAQHRSDLLLKAAVAVPIALLLSPQIRHKRQGGVVAVMGLETMLLTLGLTQTVKNTVLRPRPYTYNTLAPLELRLAPDGRRSFFSGHSSMSAAACMFTAQVYSKLYPHSRWKPLVWSGAVALPATVGFLRYRGGKHFPTDIVTGLAVGALCGWLVPRSFEF